MDKRNTSNITSSRSPKSATFHLTGWRLSHPWEVSGDLPVPLECHSFTLNMIELQLSDAVVDTSMLQCSAQLRILFINAHFVADNASHTLASSATEKPTFNNEEEVVVIHNGWTPKKKKKHYHHHPSYTPTMNPLTTFYPHEWVSFYPQATDPILVNFTCAQLILYSASANHHIWFPWCHPLNHYSQKPHSNFWTEVPQLFHSSTQDHQSLHKHTLSCQFSDNT